MSILARSFQHASLTISYNTSYHSWEHYSSVRRLAGPHTGLPRVEVSPFTLMTGMYSDLVNVSSCLKMATKKKLTRCQRTFWRPRNPHRLVRLVGGPAN